MRLIPPPASLKYNQFSLRISAHTRGATPESGHYSFERSPGARWVGSLSILPRPLSDAADIRGWIHSLRGRSGSFYLAIPYHDKPVSSASVTYAIFTDDYYFTDGYKFDDIVTTTEGTALLDGAASAGDDVVTLDTISDSSVITAGAYMRIGDCATGQLVQIVSVSGSDVTIRPRLREAWADNTPVGIGQPLGRFRLAGAVPTVPMIVGRSLEFELEIEEAY